MNQLLPFLILLLVIGCGRQPNYTIYKLPSGKQIKLMKVGKIFFSNDTPALMLQYQTDLKLSDSVAVIREVGEIWQVFKIDVDKARLACGIISAYESQGGVILERGTMHNVVFRKGDNGDWLRLGE